MLSGSLRQSGTAFGQPAWVVFHPRWRSGDGSRVRNYALDHWIRTCRNLDRLP